MATNPVSTAKIKGHPLHPMLIPFPIAFLVGAFLTDLAYWAYGNAFWALASMWLIGAAIVMALLAALAGFTDFLSEPRIRAMSDAWHHMIGNLAAVAIALINFYIRYAQGAEAAVAPWGVLLSFVVVLILLYTGWKGWEMVYRHRVAVLEAPEQLSSGGAGARRPSERDTA
jgi:uncharacterized membrane protein